MEETTTSITPVGEEANEVRFIWADYLVLASILAVSIGIGVYYAFFGSKNQTNEEYLVGGRKMNPLPVALSLLCSYVSSITLLGHPSEIYYYAFSVKVVYYLECQMFLATNFQNGTQLSMVLICYIPLTLSLIYIFVPIYFNLQFISIYEYLEWRFNRPLRLFVSVINVVYGIFLMAMVVYGPALSLDLVTGIRWQYLVAVIFIVCIFYSSMGGFKAVLWTDSIQAVLMLVSVAVVVVIGADKAGGLPQVWKIVTDNKRNTFFNTDFDPRTRHTLWTAVIGGYFQWLPMYANQAQIQRYISLPNMRAVKQALTINLFGLFFLMGLCYFAGVIIFATYAEYDPWLVLGRIKTPDQILPLFVMDTLQDYPGLSGLFVAGITCAALSTVSSAINALAATIAEDYIKAWKPNLAKSSYTSKIVSVVMGLLAFGFVFIAAEMGSIFSAASSLLGILGGPTFGAFVCGMFFPWANSVGVIMGMAFSFSTMAFVGIGSTVSTNQGKLPYQGYFGSNITAEPYWKDRGDTALIQIFSISPLWFPALGTVLSIFSGMSLSFLVPALFPQFRNKRKIESKLLIPNLLRLWIYLCPGECKRLIIFSAKELQEHPELIDESEKSKDIVTTLKYGMENPSFEKEK